LTFNFNIDKYTDSSKIEVSQFSKGPFMRASFSPAPKKFDGNFSNLTVNLSLHYFLKCGLF